MYAFSSGALRDSRARAGRRLDVRAHRIGLTYEAEAENITSEEIITEILNNVEVP